MKENELILMNRNDPGSSTRSFIPIEKLPPGFYVIAAWIKETDDLESFYGGGWVILHLVIYEKEKIYIYLNREKFEDIDRILYYQILPQFKKGVKI